MVVGGCGKSTNTPYVAPYKYANEVDYSRWQDKTVQYVTVSNGGTTITINFKDSPPLIISSYKYTMKIGTDY